LGQVDGVYSMKKKRLVLCFDGTWNTLSDTAALTNVVKLANLVTVSVDDVDQISYYNSGVGGGGPIDRYLGGLFGVGLKNNVKRGLTFLALNYQEGDEIYLFGFSRGAYTARAVAGVIGKRAFRATSATWRRTGASIRRSPSCGPTTDGPRTRPSV
jgi:uncharacterized protein (DUF2235 family)